MTWRWKLVLKCATHKNESIRKVGRRLLLNTLIQKTCFENTFHYILLVLIGGWWDYFPQILNRVPIFEFFHSKSQFFAVKDISSFAKRWSICQVRRELDVYSRFFWINFFKFWCWKRVFLNGILCGLESCQFIIKGPKNETYLLFMLIKHSENGCLIINAIQRTQLFKHFCQFLLWINSEAEHIWSTCVCCLYYQCWSILWFTNFDL